MPAPPPRRLNLLDGMILMAGLAAGCLITQVYGAVAYPRFVAMLLRYDNIVTTSPLAPSLPACWTVAEATKVATFWLATFSPIVLGLRLRQPRPALRRLFAQPGAVATLSATLATVAGVTLWSVASALAGEPRGLFLYRLTFTRLLVTTGPATALAWACMALAGRWQAERGPVDRAGRALGVGWVVAFLLLTATDFWGRIASDSVQGGPRFYLTDIIRQLDL